MAQMRQIINVVNRRATLKHRAEENIDKGCSHCGCPMPLSSQPSRKYCSNECQKAAYKLKFIGNNISRPVALNTGQIGAIGELSVCMDLISRGYDAYRAVSPSSKADIVAVKGDAIIRIEVRTGAINPSGKLAFPRKESDQCDLYAVVQVNGITYIALPHTQHVPKDLTDRIGANRGPQH